MWVLYSIFSISIFIKWSEGKDVKYAHQWQCGGVNKDL